MNEIYIVIIITILSIINKQSDAFFLKQSTFGNGNKITHRINLTIKEIENNLLNLNMTGSSPQIFPIYEKILGSDMHIIEDIYSEKDNLRKIIINNKKMEILKILESSCSLNEKIDIINNYPDFFQESKDGGLMKKWMEDEMFDDIIFE